MEHREPIRRDPAEPAHSVRGPRRVFAQLVPNEGNRRVAIGRLAACLVAGFVAVGLLLTGGSRALQSSISWLHAQGTYSLRFDEILLEPPPAPWIKPDARRLLNRVRERSGFPGVISVLDVDLDALKQAFARELSWVKEVDRIERSYPNRLVVHLKYRKPVATVRLGPEHLILDGDGVVLPEEETDAGAFGDLVLIKPEGLSPDRVEALPGKTLKIATTGTKRGAPLPIEAWAGLARFLQDQYPTGASAQPRVAVRVLHVLHGGFLYLETSEGVMVLWDRGLDPTGDEALSDDAKWAALTKWSEQHHGLEGARSDRSHKRFLDFEGGQAVLRERKR